MTRHHPQRIFPHSPPGSLLKRVGAPVQSAPRKCDADQDPAYLTLVRQCPCLHCGMEPSEAAHLRLASASYGKASGLGKKPSDRWALCLCAEHHRLARDAQHNRSEQQFWHALGINPLITCTLLYEQRGDLPAMRAVIFMTIAQRSKP
jgi:hypothetical protein